MIHGDLCSRVALLREHAADNLAALVSVLRAMRESGATQEASSLAAGILADLDASRRDLLAEQKRTLRASLPPPARAALLQSIRLQLSFLDHEASQLASFTEAAA